MRALIQRVQSASVSVDSQEVAAIGNGLLIFLGVGPNDSEVQAEQLWRKISRLRMFEDGDGKTNLSIADVGGQVLVVSQFTLYASCKKGNRPSFTQAADPTLARRLYEYFCTVARADGQTVEQGVFGALMEVTLVNHGPFTLWLDTDQW